MNTKIRITAICLLAVSIIILGCGGGQLWGEPTSKLLTSAQISEVKLELLSFQAGDLPAKYEIAVPTTTIPERFKDFPVAQNQISVEITLFGSWAGNATIFLYERQADIDKAFQLSSGTANETISGLGEKSVFAAFSIPYGTEGGTIDGANVLFVRCSAVVEIRLITENNEDVIAYAKRLDERLMPAVCNNLLGAPSETTPESTSSDFTQPLSPTPIPIQIVLTFTIDAQEADWFDTGISIQKSDEIRIETSGTIDFGGVQSDPDGNPDIQPGYGVVSTAPYGALVGMIGSGDAFIVGTFYQETAQSDGNLKLLINDVPDQYSDNSGQFNVTITITKGK